MPDEQNTQTAATTTETPALPGAEETSAQSQATDLDSLLNEFQEKTAKSDTSPAPKPQPTADVSPDVTRRVELLEKTLADERSAQALKPVIEKIRGDIPREILSDEEVLDLIDGRARRDTRLQRAWLNRANDPNAWNKIEKALGSELSKKFSKLPDPDATGDREAVTAAVRGASHKAPEDKDPNWSNMTDGELLQERKKRYGF